jgi:hypothetical protein
MPNTSGAGKLSQDSAAGRRRGCRRVNLRQARGRPWRDKSPPAWRVRTGRQRHADDKQHRHVHSREGATVEPAQRRLRFHLASRPLRSGEPQRHRGTRRPRYALSVRMRAAFLEGECVVRPRPVGMWQGKRVFIAIPKRMAALRAHSGRRETLAHRPECGPGRRTF